MSSFGLIGSARAAEGNPAEVAEGGGIHQPQQGLAAAQQLRQLAGGTLLQAMEPLRQPQSQQGFTLAPLAKGRPTAGLGGGLQALQAEVRREIPVAGLQQRIVAGLLLAVGHQRAIAALGAVVAPGFVGVIDHQQLSGRQGGGGLRQPGGQPRMQLGGEARSALRTWLQQPQGLQLCQGLRLQGLAGGQLKRGRGVRLLVKGHQLLAPERPVPLDSLHRQGIEHLVGQHHAHQRGGGEFSEAQPAAGQRC